MLLAGGESHGSKYERTTVSILEKNRNTGRWRYASNALTVQWYNHSSRKE